MLAEDGERHRGSRTQVRGCIEFDSLKYDTEVMRVLEHRGNKGIVVSAAPKAFTERWVLGLSSFAPLLFIQYVLNDWHAT